MNKYLLSNRIFLSALTLFLVVSTAGFKARAQNCSGTPAQAVVSGPVSVCPGASFSLSAGGASAGTGIVYQWQRFNGTNWINETAPGNNNLSYTVATGIAANTDFRFITTCSGQSSTSLPQTVPVSPVNCYCNTSMPTSPGDEEILNVTVGTLNQSSTCATTAPGPGSINLRYANYTSGAGAPAAPNLVTGSTVAFSIQIGTCGGTYSSGTTLFVDFNRNGRFDDAGEQVFATTGTTNGPHTLTGTFVVPVGAAVGLTGMRVANAENVSGIYIGSCGGYSYGETEDYKVNIITLTAAPGCIAAPAAPSNNSNVCLSAAPSLLRWPSAAQATSYDIYLDQAGANTLVGNTSDTFYMTSAALAAGAYTWKVIPKNSLGSATGCSLFNFTVNAPPTVSVTPANGAFCSGSVILSASGANTYSWSPATALSAATGASVTASPATITTYTVTGTDANGCAGTATSTVGPLSAFTPAPAVASQTVCGNTAATLAVAPIAATTGSMEYELTDTLGNAVAGWQSGTSFTITPAYTGLNKYFIFARNTGCPSVLSDTGMATVFYGFSATVVANNASCANGDGSLVITNPQGTSAIAPGTWYSNNFNTSTLDPNMVTLYGVASVTGNALQLTPNANSQNGGLLVKNPQGISENIDSIKFTVTIPQPNGADGFSWSFADNIVYNAGSELETGAGNKLIITFDAYGSSGPGVAGIYLKYGQNGGTAVTTSVTGTMLAYSNNASWRGNSNVPIAIYITPSGQLTLKVGATTIFNQVQLPAAYVNANRSTWQHLFAARSGGISEQHVIDNLNIYSKVRSFAYGSAPAHSNTAPAAWQSSNSFTGIAGGDSLDLWIANPGNTGTCRQKLGTFGVSAPVVASFAEREMPSCPGRNDGYIALAVNVPGTQTYSVSYSKNGGIPVNVTGITSQNNGSTEVVVIPNLVAGSYTNLKVVSAANCNANVVAGPIVLTDPGTTAIAPASYTATGTQTSPGTQYYTDASCRAIVTINSNNNLGTVNASVTVGPGLVSTASGEPLLGRYYEITPSANATLPVRLTLYFTQSDFNNYNSSSLVGGATYPAIAANGANIRIRVYHGLPSSGTTGPNGNYNGATADLIIPSGVVLNSNGFWEVSFDSPNGFSGFFVNTRTSAPLYLELGELTAVNAGTVNHLQWDTRKEKAGDRFDIERSKDGRHFTKIGGLQAKGQAPGSYSFVDELPFPGINFYRLRLAHIDGDATYSKTVQASVKGVGFVFEAFPNPVQNELYINLSEMTGAAVVDVIDMAGRVLIRQSITQSGRTLISMKHLPAGTYQVRYRDERHTASVKCSKF